ncbi:hypothetical protein ZIOFF_050934 [Zingiber officinale]|uniref:protein-serine/threonine phosphatase n=1 Tax=Zingiber officinale TaxID=94328 RepID=A0A8J5FL04_ZINOF|nr:hypothetical protein ZIOFF_050934 [Zingiber officinale]
MSVTPSASSLSVFFFSFGFVLFLSSIPPNSGESLTCLSVYREGGAPAVFHSAKCPRWTLLPDSHRLPPPNCQAAVHQGRRRSQEDRVVCALGMRIPFAGRKGIEELDVGLVAIFDGHNGAEASDMASKLLLEYFILHLYFLLDGIYSSVMKRSTHKLIYEENGLSFEIVRPLQMQKWQYQYTEKSIWISTRIFDRTFHKEILKESLLRTIQDIDATFSKAIEALQNNFESGSTAAVVLIVNGEILAVNVGNLSRLMRRRNEGAILPVAERRLLKLAIKSEPVYYVKELTVDHHADREDERSRIEAAGGHIVEWAGVARVNGQLAVSRAIGDIGFKKYGVVSTPEVTDWQHITMNDTYLIAASDGVFEKLTMQEVCDLLWYEKVKANAHLEYINNMPYSLADLLVNTAFERGAIDNMAAVVIPLKPNSIPRIYVENEFNVEETSGSSSLHLLKELGSAQFLVETEQRKLGCFYLSENLNEHTDYVFESPKVFQNRGDHGSLIDSEVPFHSGGPLKLYNDQKLCWHFGIHDGDRGQCTSPDVFVNFLGLLDSIPYSDIRTESSESFGYKLPNFRYVLKRRFDRGSYGEVWLAFHWNCSLDNDAYNSSHKMFYHFASTIEMEESKCSSNANTNSSNKRCFSDQNDDNLFILKRIMLLALKACHDRNITHRDIKPENMIVCFEDVDTGKCSREIPNGDNRNRLKMRIIDFGSAMDDFTMKHLYGSGPTRSEQTFEYTPPEALLNASWFQGPKSVTLKYDMWSVGVVMLELVLGSPHVFEINDRTRALLDQHLEGWSDHTKELAYKLRSYMEMCILIPGISPNHYPNGGRKDHVDVSPASWKCSEESFSLQVKSRDPLKIGFQDAWALRLVRQLLVWHPEDRLSVDEALRHPYFQTHH